MPAPEREIAVFISYSHDSEDHRQRVLGLSNRLRADGIESVIDQYVSDPEEGWPRWMLNQLDKADSVLVVCTETYYGRFRGNASPGTGKGADWEGAYITQDMYDKRRATRKFVPVLFSEADTKWIPDPLRGTTYYVPTTKEAYTNLYDSLLGQAGVEPHPLGSLKVKPRREGTVLSFPDDRETSPQPPSATPASLDAAHINLVNEMGKSNYSLTRLTFDYLGNNYYRVHVQSRPKPDSPFRSASEECEISRDPTAILASLSEGLPQFRELVRDSVAQSRPVRLQLRFTPAAKGLDQIKWEEAQFESHAVCGSSQFVFSRQFVLPDTDVPDIRVKPESSVRFSALYVTARPSHPPPVNAPFHWSSLAQLAPALPDDFDLATRTWEQSIGGTAARTFFPELAASDVVYMPLLVAVGTTEGAPSYAIIPDQVQGQRSGLAYYDSYQFVSMMRQLKDDARPIVLIIAPSGWTNDTNPRVFEFIGELARDIGTSGVSSVVALAGTVAARDWERFLSALLQGLRDHGIIDLAVAEARRQVPAAASAVRLYLRNKSARLWYRAGFVSVSGNASVQFDWDRLARAFTAKRDGSCAAIVGPDIDKELKLSRKAIARNIANANGFSLSSRDEENLARVSEYVKVRGRRPGAQEPLEKSWPPHVEEFVEGVRSYLIDELLPPAATNRVRALSIKDLVAMVGQNRINHGDSPYELLGRLKTSRYVTTNFHEIIELALEQAGRKPIIGSYCSRELEPAGTQETEISVDHPLVYHAFGRFAAPEHIVLAESDHLNFFADFLSASYPEVAALVRGHLVESTLIFLGFHPESWDFRVLFAALCKMPGRALSLDNVHIAVQLDPEDDLTIDPDGARNFYEGLLRQLGDSVFVYWGKPDQFLKELLVRKPEVFLP